MKRFILLSLCGVFLVTKASGQWYYDKYGVSSLSELPKSKLEAELKKAQKMQTSYIFGSVCGAALLVGGTAILLSSSDAAKEAESEEDNISAAIYYLGAFFGVTFLVGGIVLVPLTMAGIIIQNRRISDIKEALGIPELKLGIINLPVNTYPGALNCHPALGVTLTFHF